MQNLFRSTFLLFIVIFLCDKAQAQTFDIVLGRPTDNAITISILFDQNADYYISYGKQSGSYSNTSSTYAAAANIPDERDLIALTSNTNYFYKVFYKASSASTFKSSAEYSFHTARAKGSTFTFTLEADEHLYDKKGVQNMYRVTLANEAADKPDFMMTLGDIFGDDHTPNSTTNFEMDSLHKAYRPFLGSICHSVPFYVCLGNHEGEKKYYLLKNPPNNIAVYGTLARKKYYPNPYPNQFYTGNTKEELFGMGTPENYYAWTWGDALFVVLDAYRDDNDTTPKPHGWDWTLGLAQYTWLKNTLEGSTAKYKFVFAHHISGENRGGKMVAPLNEWGGYQTLGGQYNFATYRPGWAKPIHKLFVDTKVNIFFQGHDHLYAHEVLDSVVYQEVPMAADSTYNIGMLANADAYTQDTLEGTGHIRVTVSPECIKVDFVRAYLPADTLSGKHKNREIGLSYTIGACASTGVSSLPSLQQLVVYPNPAMEEIYWTLPEPISQAKASLFDLRGYLIQTSSTNAMDVSSLANGVYVLRLETGNETVSRKIVISK
ncbi:MAG: metallophosphoesterase [Bacteroidetes bacterium B1(2017)]|nr:MAG: metallophosphoesterase [Bacteroidetes bacterium B1(2017)]